MANAYSMEDVLGFLSHASERGLMPSATATALQVAIRNVFGVLAEDERSNLATLDLEDVIRRFTTKRAKEFSPSSLKEYGRRVQRAVDLFTRWKADPANFSVKTRATNANKKKQSARSVAATSGYSHDQMNAETAVSTQGGYPSSISIRPDWVVTITNIPNDLTTSEAERIASFVKLLAVG